MSIELRVPALPESVADATIATWHKKPGDTVARDENIVDLETDKVVLEVPAPEAGILGEIVYAAGATVTAGELLATIVPLDSKAGVAAAKAAVSPAVSSQAIGPATGPAVRRLLAAHDLDARLPEATGKEGRLTKSDVVDFIEQQRTAVSPSATASAADGRNEQRVPMSRLRAKVAERLVAAQHSAAMLTTFNEVNLQAIMSLRQHYKDSFEQKHGVKLGFMSFFTKAVVTSLQRFPILNASIDGQDIVYHGFFDIGIAVTTDRGLVVPIVRDADQLSLAEIEQSISESAGRARSGKLSLAELQGGTFTITNGGVFGSLLSTPIINPPQTAILGMHKIQDRPVVENGQIVIRPMMYLALSYDHRLIDGKDSVQFLVSVKSLLEDPSRLLLNV